MAADPGPATPIGPGDRVLIVGASSGVGHEVESALAPVCRTSSWARSLDPTTSTPQRTRLRVDVADYDQVLAAIRSEERAPFAVVLCAATAAWGRVGRSDPAAWTRQVEVNLLGAYHVLDAYVRTFDTHPRRTVLIGSEASVAGCADRSAYHASKAALSSFAQSFRLEAAESGGQVCEVRAGKIDTDFSPTAGRGAAGRVAMSAAAVADQVVGIIRGPHDLHVRSVDLCQDGGDFGPSY